MANTRYFPSVSSLLFDLSQKSTPYTTRMTTCPACEHTLTLPPSINYILTHYPGSVKPLHGINRRIPRCKHCDLMAANNKAIDAEFPPPSHENPVVQIEKHIEEAKRLIEEDVRKDEMEAALMRMRERLRKGRGK